MDNKNFDELPEEILAEKPTSMGEHLEDYYKSLGSDDSKFLGIETGLKVLDDKSAGLRGLIVLAGQAGEGKTSLALQLAYGACEKGTPVIFYSLEMPRQAIITKIFNRLAQVSYKDIVLRGGRYLDETRQDKNLLEEDVDFYNLLKKEEVERLKEAKADLEKVGDKFYIRSYETGQKDITVMGSPAKEEYKKPGSIEEDILLVKKIHNAEDVFIVIDQLQDVEIPNEEFRDQLSKEGKVMRELRKINGRTGATFLLISHKNKAEYKTVEVTSVKGSVDLIYKPEVVMLLQGEKEQEQGGLGDTIANFSGQVLKRIDLVIVKNRYDPPCRIKLDFNGEYGSFTERDE